MQAYLSFQESHIAVLQEQVAALQGEVTKLRLQLADAQARTNQHLRGGAVPMHFNDKDLL